MTENASDAVAWLGRGFRCMFYSLSPSELALSADDDVPSLIGNPGTPMFFVLVAMEYIGMAIASPGKVSYRFNDLLASISMGGVQQIFMLTMMRLGVELAKKPYSFIHRNFRIVDLDVKRRPLFTWISLLLGVDLAYYWSHRLLHTFQAAWASHSAHHSGEDYNLATALRQGSLQPLFTWILPLPLALVFPAPSILVHSQLNTLSQFWIHTELLGRLGPLEYVVNTPFHHRMHHRPPGNCNYAGALIIWDRIFGTYQAETERLDYYGLAQQAMSFDPVDINFLHFRRLGGMHRWLAKRANHAWFHFNPAALFSPFAPMEDGISSWTLPSNTPRREKYEGARLGLVKKLVAMVAFAMYFVTSSRLQGTKTRRSIALVAAGGFLSLHALGKMLDKGELRESTLMLAVSLVAIYGAKAS